MKSSGHQASLFSAICIGVGTIIGSGWLFASYYAAKYSGPIAIVAWIIGALLSMLIAFLLAEVATIYPQRGLFARLLTLSHNRDFGFILAISNWFVMVLVIPSEATATIQYLSGMMPSVAPYIFANEHLTIIGLALIGLIMIIYGILNYWGIKSLAHSNNIITSIKLIVPALTGIIIICSAFHPGNFTLYKNTIAPYGISTIFSAIVNCGIFYAFYGFGLVTVFARELKNPEKNMPIALFASVLICLLIYLILQIAFIGAINPSSVVNGWHQLNFTSPLAQLASLLGINWLAMILYADSALSPSGTGIIYAGSGGRMLNSMAEDGQMPKVFAPVHPVFHLSRSSLTFTILLSFIPLFFFSSWQKIMVVVTVFQLISCIAVPISFSKLRQSKPEITRLFKMPWGQPLSLFCFLILSYLLIQSGTVALVLSLCLHIVFFIIYCMGIHKLNPLKTWNSFKSSMSLFLFLSFSCIFGYLQENNHMQNIIDILIFVVLSVVFYYVMVGQRFFEVKK